jgi:hypothetical protein
VIQNEDIAKLSMKLKNQEFLTLNLCAFAPWRVSGAGRSPNNSYLKLAKLSIN